MEDHSARGRFCGGATRRPAPGKGPRRPEEAGAVKKGFLGGGGGGGASTKKAAAAERPDLTVVRKAEGADPLRLADVQRSMDEQAASSSAKPKPKPKPKPQPKPKPNPNPNPKPNPNQAASSSAAKVGGGGAPEWVTPALLQQIAADPLLRKAFTDPKRGAMLRSGRREASASTLPRRYGEIQGRYRPASRNSSARPEAASAGSRRGGRHPGPTSA
jgi:outer membrane biosynthesis protein TonB